jgi:hypothetical protein
MSTYLLFWKELGELLTREQRKVPTKAAMTMVHQLRPMAYSELPMLYVVGAKAIENW